MEARIIIQSAFALIALASMGASHRTPNFVVTAPTPEIAQQVGKAAEHYREALAIEWLGHTLPNWRQPCTVQVQVGQMGAGGATTFSFDRGHVFGWRMTLQGSLERILDSVLPHEVSHTIFACHFRRPLPRWADEGAATLAEHDGEQRRQTLRTGQILRSSRRIPLKKLLPMTEYPNDSQDVMTLYAQGYSLADFLVQQQGRAAYLSFIEDAHRRGWNEAIQRFYGYRDIDSLEKKWNAWVLAGSPSLPGPNDAMLADADAGSGRAAGRNSEVVVRGQSPGDAGGHSQALSVAAAQSSGKVARPEESLTSTLREQASDKKPLPRGRDLHAPQPRETPATLVSDTKPAEQPAARKADEGWTPIPVADRRPLPAPNRPLAETNSRSPNGGDRRTTPPANDRFELPTRIDDDRSLQTPFRQVAMGEE
jgi:hypothetical protein